MAESVRQNCRLWREFDFEMTRNQEREIFKSSWEIVCIQTEINIKESNKINKIDIERKT